MKASGRLTTPLADLVLDLQEYGESGAAVAVQGLPSDSIRRIEEIAFENSLSGMYLAKALALAAVEVIEGRPRQLVRKRRRFIGRRSRRRSGDAT